MVENVKSIIYHDKSEEKSVYIKKTFVSMFVYALIISLSISISKLVEIMFSNYSKANEIKFTLAYIVIVIIILFLLINFLSIEIAV